MELDGIFNEDEIKKFKKVIGLKDTDDPSEAILQITNAALNEYKQMLLGMGLPSRADEILQYRLYYLIKHYFNGKIPTEPQVSSMFQLTPQRSRSLIRAVMTRFRFDLENEVENTLRKTVSKAKWDDQNGEFRIVIRSYNIVEQLNRIIESKAPDLDPVRKIQLQARTYRISEDSCIVLCRALEISCPTKT